MSLILFALAVAGNQQGALESVQVESRRYYTCINSAALKLEPSGEPAEVVIRAAVTSCSEQRERVHDTCWVDLLIKEPGLSSGQASARTERVLALEDADAAKKALPLVLTQRARRKR